MFLRSGHCALHTVAWLAIVGAVACSERVPTTPTPAASPAPSPAPTTPSCTYEISSTNRLHHSGPETSTVIVTAPPGCAWTASSDMSWITIAAGGSGIGNGTVSYAVEPNTGPARTATLTIAGRSLTINQLTPTPGPYDGRWVGSGRGASSGSTPALMEITLQITDGIVRLSMPWRIDTAPGTPQSSFCTSMPNINLIRIVLGAFSSSISSMDTYRYVISGTFASPNSVSGTAQITPTDPARPWCLGATIPWTATKQ